MGCFQKQSRPSTTLSPVHSLLAGMSARVLKEQLKSLQKSLEIGRKEAGVKKPGRSRGKKRVKKGKLSAEQRQEVEIANLKYFEDTQQVEGETEEVVSKVILLCHL